MPLVLMPPAVKNMNRNARNYSAIARLADGVTIERARAELIGIGDGLASQYPDTQQGHSCRASRPMDGSAGMHR